MLASFLLSCVSPPNCPAAPTLMVPTDSRFGANELRMANEWSAWMGGLCLSELHVSSNAPLGGETWKTSEGYAVSVNRGGFDLPSQLCRVYDHQHGLVEGAPDDLFIAEEGRTRLDAFADACAVGPMQRAYIDAAVAACGAEPRTRTEAFLEQHVFTGLPLPTAPTWRLIEQPRVEVDVEPTLIDLVDLPVEGELSLSRDANQIGWPTHVSVMFSNAPPVRAVIPVDVVLGIAVDDTHIYLHGRDEGQFYRTQWTLDRATGAMIRHDLDWNSSDLPTDTFTRMVRGNGFTAISSPTTFDRWPMLGIVMDDGQHHRIDLTTTDDGYGIEHLWVDPLSADHLIVELRRVQDDNEEHIDVLRVNARTGTFDVLHSQGRITDQNPAFQAFGVLNDGSVAYIIGTSNEGRLMGVQDRSTNRLKVSRDSCVYWDSLRVIDGQVVELPIQTSPGIFTQRRWVPAAR